MHASVKTWAVVTFAICLMMASVGLALVLVSSRIFNLVVRSLVLLGPNSMAEQMWESMPVPLQTSLYLFEVANPEGVVERGEDPQLMERGPYVFDEFHVKTNVTWIDRNDTVTYLNTRRYVFRPDLSNGTLDDNVTIINIPPATIATMVSPILRPAVSGFLKAIKEKLMVTKPVREIIFDGYNDPMLTFLSDLEKIISIPGATDKFAIYYKRNMSATYDGVYNMFTGRNGDPADANQIYSWNYSPTMGKFQKGSRCDMVRGSGDMFQPYLTSSSQVAFFSNDLCRPIDLRFADVEYVGNTQGYQYRVTPDYFANSSVNPENSCYEDKTRLGELPSGVYYEGPCQFQAPVYISQPHFYQADPYYASLLAPGSVRPNKDDHETLFVIEPQTGIPLKVLARFQVNVHIEPTKSLFLFDNLKHPIFFPAFWFESKMVMTGKIATELWLMSNLEVIIRAIGFTFVGLGLGATVIGAIFFNVRMARLQQSGPSAPSGGDRGAPPASGPLNEDRVPIISAGEDTESGAGSNR